MDFSDKRTSVSAGFFLFGLSLASFALFLHPLDPIDFLVKAVFSPQETFPIVSGYLQSMAFWFSGACVAIGIAGMVGAVVRRQRKTFPAQGQCEADDKGEEHWIFL